MRTDPSYVFNETFSIIWEVRNYLLNAKLILIKTDKNNTK